MPNGRRWHNLSLQGSAINAVATNIDRYDSLGLIPLDVCTSLLRRVLELGLLTPHAAKIFEETHHPEIKQWLKENLRSSTLPPVLTYPERCGL